MKRVLLSAVVAALLPAMALAQTTNPKAKVDPKNNKVSRPVVEKPKPKLMTREELRTCLVQNEKNDEEAKAIKAEEARIVAEREELKALKEILSKEGETLSTNQTALLAERDAIIKENEGLKDALSKLSRKEGEALIEAYKTKAAAMDARVDAHNKAKVSYLDKAKVFDARIEPHNKANRDLSDRADNHLEDIDNWKKACANKPYDEADEIAVRKELAAAAK